MTLILGQKQGMTQVFTDDGAHIGVTVVAAGPCVVTQVRTNAADGYDAVQLAFSDKSEKNTKKPQIGHFKKAGTTPKRFVKEERLSQAAEVAIGDQVTERVKELFDEHGVEIPYPKRDIYVKSRPDRKPADRKPEGPEREDPILG